MDTNLHHLPPLKRFRLLQQEKQPEAPNPPSSHLPAKKRKQQFIALTIRSLPAKKRVRAIEPESSPIESNSVAPTILSLPAKKRVGAIEPEPSLIESNSVTPTVLSLPAKKRVWAIKPEFSPIKPPSTFDLNIEYDPSLDDNVEREIPEEKQPTQFQIEEKDGNDDDDDDDDGILCAVCGSTDGDPTDPIVFCDGCDLMVHSTCYGNPLVKSIPEGDWFCAQCSVSKPSSVGCCCLCPASGSAMKPTTDGRWAHIVCALLVPEVFFDDPEGREGIDCSKIPKRRWREVCYVCNGQKGCAVECSEPKCPLAFHVTCGLKEDLSIEFKEGKSTGGIVAGFCKDHTELWKKQQQTGKFKIVARDE